MVAVGFNPRLAIPNSSVRRVATSEISGVADQRCASVPERNVFRGIRCPWVETHGYHRMVATQREGETKLATTIGGFHHPTPGPSPEYERVAYIAHRRHPQSLDFRRPAL